MIPETERTPLVELLLARIEQLLEEQRRQAEFIGQLRDEIAILKGEKARPKFKPSGMEQQTEPETPEGDTDGDTGTEAGDETGGSRKRPGSAKRPKTAQLTIHDTVGVPPGVELPAGSRFKGYRDFVVQDLRITPHNTRYRLEVWQTPDGEQLVGTLPSDLYGGHFGADLRRYVLYQHHHCQVTQPLLHEQLREWGIDISAGQIDALLTGHTGAFLAEKDQLLTTALEVSRWISVDDSGARHQGRNGYVTQIGNDWFAWFASTYSKSRINFLQLLQAGERCYTLNSHALEYWCEEGLPAAARRQLQSLTTITGTPAWEAHLDALGITSERHRRIATEGALLGGLIEQGFSLDLAIISDGAGQFAILLHALCWVHAERLVHKLIPLNDRQRADQARVRGEIWDLYADLKAYRRNPDPALRPGLEERFDTIFTQRTSYITLDRTLKRLHTHKSELLRVLERPDLVLNTNGSESDIRGYVKWRKISGGTRSDLGKDCRDGFASLKKTCRKLGISFWDYLGDRIKQLGTVPLLPDLIRERALAASATP
ncbi:transposase [Thiocapsa sp. C3-3m]|uniref:IS66 family transposase n=1 Tax=Thiocapsa sp. C3-3m TaxID=3137394 RepID=UPI0035B28A65